MTNRQRWRRGMVCTVLALAGMIVGTYSPHHWPVAVMFAGWFFAIVLGRLAFDLFRQIRDSLDTEVTSHETRA